MLALQDKRKCNKMKLVNTLKLDFNLEGRDIDVG